ncbi:Fic family protein [Thiocapsa imhoffii]|uniref:Fic family protein n=1 Tax=Thiocapsa imhoffii TaxID=382777 RepID=UPI00353049F4
MDRPQRPTGERPLPALTRAGIALLYFVSIHPFEDGNGRIARAIAEQVLAQGLGQPTLIALSHTIERHKKAYYAALERANKVNRIDDWLDYFSHTVLDALEYTHARVVFLIRYALNLATSQTPQLGLGWARAIRPASEAPDKIDTLNARYTMCI